MSKQIAMLFMPDDVFVYIPVKSVNRNASKIKKQLGSRLTIRLYELENLLQILPEIDDSFDNTSIYIDELGLCLAIFDVYRNEVLGLLMPVYILNKFAGNIKQGLKYCLNRQVRKKLANKIDYTLTFDVSLN